MQFEDVEAISRGIAAQLGGDSCHAINHLMRAPGTTNWPNTKKRAAGRKPAPATILQADNGRTYSLEELEEAFAPLEEPASERVHVDADGVEPITADDLGLGPFDPIRSVIDHPAGANGSADVLRCAGDMVRARYPDKQTLGILLNPANAVSAHIFRQSDPRRAALRALQKAKAKEATREGAQAHSGCSQGPGGNGNGNEAPGASAACNSSGEIEAIPLKDAAEFEGLEVRPREWAVEGLIPTGLVTMFGGNGAVGKSQLGQQTATNVALGRRFLKASTSQIVALYMTFEDDERELHARQAKINAALGISFSELSGKLFLASLCGEREKGLARFDQSNRMTITRLFERLKRTLLKYQIGFLVIDNVAHVFEGNEISRAQVTAFLGVLHALALETNCTIVLIAHPNKAGDSYSGSTAWQNQVRSQLSLESDPADRDRRFLRRVKANYAPNGEEIVIRWHQGVFWHEEEMPPGAVNQATIIERAENERFLDCLAARTRQKRPVSEHPNARESYAPRAFASMPEAHGMKQGAFKRAMERLLNSGVIERAELDFERPGTRGHRAVGLKLVPERKVEDEPY